MKILLVAVNAKFTHMNPAVYSIRSYAGEYAGYMEIAEYTINQYARDVLSDIYEKNPDVIGFSCYIWNIRFIGELLEDIKKVLPEASVFLGGPEVSYNPGEVLEKFPTADGIFCGEGERPWKDAAEQFAKYGKLITSVPGLVLRNTPAKVSPGDLSSDLLYPVYTETGSLDQLPFIFDDLSAFENRMLYYETSRGCPFRCTYCISSIEKHMRFRSLGKVYPELQFFIDRRVRIVKFIDRTFNADHDHAMGIWNAFGASGAVPAGNRSTVCQSTDT